MQFLNNIKSSIYNPAYYSEILNKPFSYSLKYFLSLAALIALVSTIIFSFSVLPKMNKVVGKIGPELLNYYPDNLEVTVKNGKVSTNVEEPYFIKMPAELKDETRVLEEDSVKSVPAVEKLENFLVIDTVSPLTSDLLKNYKTIVLLGYDSMAYRESSGAMKIQPLDQSINGVITKTKFSAMLDKVTPYIKIIPFVLIPFVFAGVWIGFVFVNLIYLIFGAAVIWLAAKIRKRDLKYGASYRIGLHAITLGAILEATVFWFLPSLEIPFLFTFLMVVVVWVNLKFASNIENVPPAPTSVGKI